MKYTLLYLSSLLVVFAMGCSNTSVIPVVKNKTPVGSFSGVFLYIHTPANTTTLDTLQANVQIIMNSDKSYSVLGDTTTLQAGSHGIYSMDSSAELQFFDATYSASSTSKKVHLSGIYQFTYDGVYFTIQGTDPADTVQYKYKLTKN